MKACNPFGYQELKKFYYRALSHVLNVSFFKYIAILAESDSRNKRVFMDLGCGNGASIKAIARMFPDVHCVGIDLIQKNENFKNISFVRGDILSFVSSADFSQCSLIILNDVIEHFDRLEIQHILCSLIDKLPLDCLLCLQFPNMSSPFGLRNYYGDHTHKTPLTDLKMSEMLAHFSQISYRFDGVEEVEAYDPFSILLALVYWKPVVWLYSLFLKRSIGWNKSFFSSNLLLTLKKSPGA